MTNREQKHYLNIIVSRTKTKIGGMIRTVIGGDFNHCSFCVDGDFGNIYGFSRRYREFWFTGCFTKENAIHFEEYRIYDIPISTDQHRALQERIADMNAHIRLYNYLSALMLPAGVGVDSDDSFICSTFVADLIEKYTDIAPEKKVSLHGPMDIYELLEGHREKGNVALADIVLPHDEEFGFNDPLTSWTRPAIRIGEKSERIICRGGDRDLSRCVDEVIRSGASTPIALIPSGTTNDFAKTIGVPTDSEKAAELAQGDIIRRIDSGSLDGRNFISIAGFGDVAHASHSTSERSKKAMGYAAYVLTALQMAADMREYDVEVSVDGRRVRGKYLMMLVTNAHRVGGIRLWDRVSPDDGKMEVLLLKRPELDNIHETVEKYHGSQISIRNFSDYPLEWVLDGEKGGTTDPGETSGIEVMGLSYAMVTGQ